LQQRGIWTKKTQAKNSRIALGIVLTSSRDRDKDNFYFKV
jgi:hypothetical protein